MQQGHGVLTDDLRRTVAEDPEEVSKIVYFTCSRRLRIIVATHESQVWCIIDDGATQRWLRLFDPQGLEHLVGSFAYLDADGCLNLGKGKVWRGERRKLLKSPPIRHVSLQQRNTPGVPQRLATSGICWFCAMCFAMFFSKPMYALFWQKAPARMRHLMKHVLHDPEQAERFRRFLYEEYALGDDPDQNPLRDGQNGFVQLCILLASLDVPVIRMLAGEDTVIPITGSVYDKQKRECILRTDASPDEVALLVVRVFRSHWSPVPRVRYKGRRYYLTAAMIGSEHCGHQVAVSAVAPPSCSSWAHSDSDATRKKIGPMFWTICKREDESNSDYIKRWKQMWEDMIPATLFGDNEVCDLNPVNRSTYTLQTHFRVVDEKNNQPGVVNTDFIYLSDPIGV